MKDEVEFQAHFAPSGPFPLTDSSAPSAEGREVKEKGMSPPGLRAV
jgi:hypothetical protein